MSEFRGTGGEWSVCDLGLDQGARQLFPAVDGLSLLSLVGLDGHWFSVVHDEHDARLFAASKRLLEALIEAKCWVQRTGTPQEHGAKCETLSCVEDMIDSAINNALGDDSKEANAN